jgi:peptide/nickel transport system substrate-binding protein
LSRRFLKRGWAGLAVLLALSFVVFLACNNPNPTPQEIIFVGETIGGIDSLDPAWAYDSVSREQLTYIYETLMAFAGESTSELLPVLADALPTVAGANVIFHIRSGVHFQNGHDLTAEDVEYSIERAMVMDRADGPQWMLYRPLLGLNGSRDGDSDLAINFTQIDDAVTVCGDNVTFHLHTSSWVVRFEQILTGTWCSIVDKQWCIANGEWDGTEAAWKSYNNNDNVDSYLWEHANGTGPWELTQTSHYRHGMQITLTANDDWWQGTPPFDTVITKFVDDFSTRRTDLLNGNADTVYAPHPYFGQIDDYAGLKVYRDLPALQCDALLFNFNITVGSGFIGSGALDGLGIPADFFTDDDVRIGFAEAFDWDTYITQVMGGEAMQIAAPVVQGLPYYNPDTPKYSYDPEDAALHLQAAWGGQVWENGFNFTLTYDSGNIERKWACEILAENLFRINSKFQFSVRSLPLSTILDSITEGDTPMVAVSWTADYPDPDDFVVPFMASWGIYARGQGHDNPAVDSLILQGEETTDVTERTDIYYQLQQIYYDDVPGIVLAQPRAAVLFSPDIRGYYFNPMIPGTPGPLWHMSKSES